MRQDDVTRPAGPRGPECDGHFDGYFGQPESPPPGDRAALVAYLLGYEQGRRDAGRDRADVRRLRCEWAGVEDGFIGF